MDSKNLLIALIKANSTTEVVDILNQANLWNDPKCWKNLGGDSKTLNATSIIQNQQSDSLHAFDELPVNCIDTLLTLEAKKQGLDVEDPNVTPKSVREASEQFFNVPEGKLINLDPLERSALAEKNIGVMATGKKGCTPCLSVWDCGEGQSPQTFKDTLLSIAKDNKAKINFVTGKMNQGSTGSLSHCGEHHLKLILSKRNPAIQTSNESNDITYTIVKRKRPVGPERGSTYVYLVLNGVLPSFSASSLPILPDTYPKSYGKDFEHGTFIKLYDYRLKGLNTNITLDFANRMSSHLVSPVLPIRLYERRKGYKAHSYETTMSGLEVRLEEDRSNNVEPNFPLSGKISADKHEFTYQIYALNREATAKRKFKRDEGLLFIYNGQTHASIPSSFYTKKSVNMSYIKDSLVTMIDCSNLSSEGFEDLFMSSRDRLRDSDLKDEILESLESVISNHSALKKLREERQRIDVKNKIEDAKPLEQIYEKIVKTQPNLSKLMTNGMRLSDPFNSKGGARKKFTPKRFPDFFKLIKKYDNQRPKECEFSRIARIQFESNVDNDYFSRSNFPGKIDIKIDGKVYSGWGSLNGYEGIWTLNLNIPQTSKPGSLHIFEIGISDNGPNKTHITETFTVKVIPNISKKNLNSSGQRKSKGGSKKGKGIKNSKLGFPQITFIDEDNWDNVGFDKDSGLLIREDGKGGHIYFINSSNINLLHEQKTSPTVEPELLQCQYALSLAIFGMSLVMDYEANRDSYTDDIETLSKKLSKWASPVALPTIRGLGMLEIS